MKRNVDIYPPQADRTFYEAVNVDATIIMRAQYLSSKGYLLALPAKSTLPNTFFGLIGGFTSMGLML